MISASQMLFDHLRPGPVEGCEEIGASVPCWVCSGYTTRGMPQRAWAGSSYTGQNKVRAPGSSWVCEACVHIHSRIAPVPGRPPAEGKKLGGNFRNYSHLFEQTSAVFYQNASKAEKPAILDFLRRPKVGLWWAAIADSGQKHVIPGAPINAPGLRGRVLFEETVVELPRPDGWALVNDTAALLTAGATKEEIGRGLYGAGAWERCPTRIRSFESCWARLRHGAWFILALWLAQRDEEAVAARRDAEAQQKAAKAPRRRRGREDEGEVANAHRGGAARGPRGVPGQRRQPDEALGSAPEPDAQRGAAERDRRGVGHGALARTPAAGAQQLGLPGLAGPDRQGG